MPEEFDCALHQEDKDEIYMCLSCYEENVASRERNRIMALIQSKEWVGITLAEDVDNLVRLIKGNK